MIGKMICPVCNGNKHCTDCDGKGWKTRTVNVLGRTPHRAVLTGRAYEKKKEVCRSCHGNGQCPECHGTGFIEDPKAKIISHTHEKFQEYVDNEDYDKAEQLLNEAINQNGQHPCLLYDLGQLLSIKGNKCLLDNKKEEANKLWNKSIHIFENILSIDPSHKEAYLNLCVIYHLYLQDYIKVIEVAEKCLKLFPKYYNLIGLYCMSLNKMHQYDKVLNICEEKIREIDIDNDLELDSEVVNEDGELIGTVREQEKGGYLVCMGDAFFGKGEFVKAKEFYERAKEIPSWSSGIVINKLQQCREKIINN